MNSIDTLESLIAETVAELLDEETIEEAERQTLSNKLGKLLAKRKPKDREKIIVDFFKVLKSGQGYEKLFPTWPKMPEEKKKILMRSLM